MVEDACRGIDTNGSLAAAWTAMEKAGVKRITSEDVSIDSLTSVWKIQAAAAWRRSGD